MTDLKTTIIVNICAAIMIFMFLVVSPTGSKIDTWSDNAGYKIEQAIDNLTGGLY